MSNPNPSDQWLKYAENFGGEMREFAEFVLRDPNMTSDSMLDYLSKRPLDVGSIYSKFMAACLVLWFAPDAVRAAELRPSRKSERIFDLLWSAYEQWLNRGISHYAEVAGELNNFYGTLRRMMIENRDRAPASELDRVTAEAASIYLQKVTALAKKNFDTFIGEMDGVLRKLDAMKAEPDEAAEG